MDQPAHHSHQSFYVSIIFFFGRLFFGLCEIANKTGEYLPELKEITKEAFMAVLFFAVSYACGRLMEKFKKANASK
jgi:hypothetical protein